MSESFLHYIWQLQYFAKSNLTTTVGEELTVLKAGFLNSDSGPDFFNSKVRIDGIDWVGNIEVHIKSSDWYAHHHDQDGAYNNVILHVVWENDKPAQQNNILIPTLELKDRVDPSLILAYRKLINSNLTIACEKSFPDVDDLVKVSMLDKSLMHRLEAKANDVTQLLKTNNHDWDETLYQMLSRNFGFKVNSDSFFQLSRSLPFKIIQKQNSLIQVEALLFGQAGMLETKTKDEYISALFREYRFLAQKYSLSGTQLSASQWRFLRLRPANFPTIRLAQLAALLFHTKNIFSSFISRESYKDIQNAFNHGQSDYWKLHYRFGKKAKNAAPELGESSIQNVVINSLVPLLIAYGKYKDEHVYIDRAIELLQQMPGEENKITRQWNSLGMKVKTSFDSQALIELHNNFCQKRQCLNCTIGISILKPAA